MNRKLIIGTISLLSTVLLSTVGLTFAWFTYGSDLAVNNIELRFSGDKKILISAHEDLSTFKSELDDEDLIYTERFIPCSTIYSDEWLPEKPELPIYYGGYTQNMKDAQRCQVAVTGFFQQELYLYSEDSVIVTLDKDIDLFSPIIENNERLVPSLIEKYPLLNEEQILNNLNNVIKSMRISVLIPDEENYKFVIYDPFKESETYLGGLLDNNNDNYYDSHSKNGVNCETIFGDVSNLENIIYSSSGKSIPSIPTCFDAGTKPGVRHVDIEESINNGLTIATEHSIGKNDLEKELQIPLNGDEPTKIVLSIYLEGWDRDNTNLSMYASFATDIKFKILKEIF